MFAFESLKDPIPLKTMFSFQVDLGQLLIVGAMGIIGWFVKKELTTINERLDGHDERIFTMMGQLQNLVGALSARSFLGFQKGVSLSDMRETEKP